MKQLESLLILLFIKLPYMTLKIQIFVDKVVENLLEDRNTSSMNMSLRYLQYFLESLKKYI